MLCRFLGPFNYGKWCQLLLTVLMKDFLIKLFFQEKRQCPFIFIISLYLLTHFWLHSVSVVSHGLSLVEASGLLIAVAAFLVAA